MELSKWLSAEVESGDELQTIRIVGELDLAGAAPVYQLMVSSPGPTVVIDLAEVTFIDCAGLGGLLDGLMWHGAIGHVVLFHAPGGATRRLFSVLNLEILLDSLLV